MSSSSNYLATVRVVTFATTIVFSTIVGFLSTVLAINIAFEVYLVLPLFTSLFTICTVIPMYVIGRFRQGSIFSRIAFEIGWLSFLWVLFLTSGSYLAWADSSYFSSCSHGFASEDPEPCHEIKATTAFSFLLWIILMAYTTLLLVLSMRAHQQGRPAWTAAVRDGVLLYSSDKNVERRSQAMATPPTIHESYPPPPQQSFP